ncbi:hypothetical protein CVT24_011474 [Panaeolus cyanescens]|uniref:Arf-GAP domain-containing protein n=1 Tax=Panaeolus cyanescens TaxID=181874 RepID=A0A409VGI2_9AGAR|nr:hypothetical protein CVT24_011474 [Panaeolus cyanescens]
MSDQVAAKKILSELSKREDLKNKASMTLDDLNYLFMSFVSSFVRSISMDTWQDDQVKRMQLGSNLAFKEFMNSYQPADQGGYKEGASAYDIYHCWAAAQYRSKLDAVLAGKDWSPSPPPANFNTGARSASPAPSAQGLRKSRASNRTLAATRSDSHSPASSLRSSSTGTPNPTLGGTMDQKTANENYFAGLGKLNESRSSDLPPSQGGKYTGFGSTPTPEQHPSYGLSSANAPSLSELQENPVAAISKGWSLFAAAVVGASRVVQENVIQPGVEKVTDPNFQASVRGYMTEAQKQAAAVGSTANEWSRSQLGVDVAGAVGGVVGTVRERVAGGSGPSRAGYGHVSMTSPGDADETSGLYYDNDDDLFTEYRGTTPATTNFGNTHNAATTTTKAAPAKKSSDWDDEWKDF